MKTTFLALASLLALSTMSCAHLDKTNQTTTAQTPPLERIQTGNARFAQHHMLHPDQTEARIKETAAGQKPFAIVLSCSDSRVAPEIIFDQGIGDLFVIRNAGNIVEEEDVLASMEYAVEHLGVRSIIVLGHERCGAIDAMTHDIKEDEPKHIIAILEHLKNEQEVQKILKSGKKGDELVHECVAANVQHGIAALHEQMGLLKGHNDEKIDVVISGAVYDIQTGKVAFLNSATNFH